MSTVKISDLPELPSIASNTSNTLFLGVDIPTGVTGKFTATTLAGQLYANNFLVVGDYEVNYPNAVGMFAWPSETYIQTIIENESDDGTSDFVAQANVSTDTVYFIDYGFAGSNYDNSNPNNSLGDSLYPLDGYIYVQGDTSSDPGGNLVIGTATSGKTIKIIAGGIEAQNITATIDSTGVHLKKNLYFSDTSVQSTAAAPINYTQASFDQGNTAYNYAVAANTYHTSYTNTANTWLKNYTDTANTYQTAYTNTANTYHTTLLNTANTFLQANDYLIYTYASSAYNKANNALANTTGIFAGDLTVTGNVAPQKGFIYTPNNHTTNATTYTVDFARDSLVRMSVNDNMTISLQNFVQGKIVEVFITNSAAQNKTITHGCYANSSTSHTTTFTITSQSCAYLRYASMNTDLGNTFVSITS